MTRIQKFRLFHAISLTKKVNLVLGYRFWEYESPADQRLFFGLSIRHKEGERATLRGLRLKVSPRKLYDISRHSEWTPELGWVCL